MPIYKKGSPFYMPTSIGWENKKSTSTKKSTLRKCQIIRPMPMPSARQFFFRRQEKNSPTKSNILPAKHWFYEVKMYFLPAKCYFSLVIFFWSVKKNWLSRLQMAWAFIGFLTGKSHPQEIVNPHQNINFFARSGINISYVDLFPHSTYNPLIFDQVQEMKW